MKKILMFAMFCLSPSVFAEGDFCTEQKGVLETSIGTYKFKTIEYCQLVYKRLKKCQDDNVLLGEKMLPRVECSDILQGLIDSGSKNIEKVNDQ
ncbi:hypothetical protein SHI21_17220 [Bacteriovorax sp. PP10]|uniref:YARHG domain-containing protein n=1 Tax=Bacteriovorax antarcticus TaxID=3088717 RepID=A0ABU5VY94_9BACT|nr:hypothetical protein [Bacteriovorax sp. PP10]MEA9357976.1 hypothetical protein [Bacteriovorax sp. PP10]